MIHAMIVTLTKAVRVGVRRWINDIYGA